MKKTIFLFVVLVSLLGQSEAQNLSPKTLVEKAGNSFMKSGPRVGISIGLVVAGKSYVQHFGSTEKAANKIPSNHTIYEIGSMTKTFTSLLLAQAVLDKKVSLNDDIRKYLKGDYPNLEYQGKGIKLIHLANLTSGLPDNLPEAFPVFKSKDRDSQLVEYKQIHDVYTRDQFLADLHTVKLKRAPGLSTAHSNTAAELMGFILENIYGSSYPELLKKYIIGPYQMNSTFLTVPGTMKNLMAKGYSEEGTEMPAIPLDSYSAGALNSTLPDMMNFIDRQLTGQEPRIKLQQQLAWGNMESQGSAMNWWVKTNFDGKRKLWISGGTFGFVSYAVIYPERGFAMVMLANESDREVQGKMTELAQEVYNELYFSKKDREALGFGYSRSVNALLAKLNPKDFKGAAQAAAALKSKNTWFRLTEDELNAFGYYLLLHKGLANQALEIFKLNTALYPKSSNAFDSLAEAFETKGDKEQAVKNYKRSLELNPQNSNASEHLNKLETGKSGQ